MQRRKPGQSNLTTDRAEDDDFTITSGIIDGMTTGAPIHIAIPNKNARSKDYGNLKEIFRPSHADYTYHEKYGIRDHRGGGRSSARETACRVVVGAIAKQFLALSDIDIQAYTSQIGPIKMIDHQEYTSNDVESNLVRCPDQAVAAQMRNHIMECKNEGDTCGGVVRCILNGVPTGLGSPIYDKMEARLASAMLSINACVGFEMGLGFESINLKGSAYNDAFFKNAQGDIKTKTNHGGGVQGGISNGMPIYFNTAFKPVSSIKKEQRTVTKEKESTSVQISGRHDPCVVPRAVPVVEAMAAILIADFLLARRMDRV